MASFKVIMETFYSAYRYCDREMSGQRDLHQNVRTFREEVGTNRLRGYSPQKGFESLRL